MRRSIKLWTVLIALVSLCLVFASCDSGSSDSDDVIPVTGVTLDKTELTITVGDADVKLTATVLPDNATDKTVSWTSDKTDVARVDQDGNVHAVASGTATITVTTVDGSKTATCEVTVALPAGALAGEFSVSENKKVYFSKGNLWADGSNALHFESNQYSFANSWNASHVSHFTWSSTVGAAVGSSNSGNNLFCDKYNKVSVDGGAAIYYALSVGEWEYLIKTRTMTNGKDRYSNAVSGVSIEDTIYKGLFLYPDNYNGDVVSDSMTWEQINAAGIVFLPAAGLRFGSNVGSVGDNGVYWSATPNGDSKAYYLNFHSSGASMFYVDRCYGRSVRLVCGEN